MDLSFIFTNSFRIVATNFFHFKNKFSLKNEGVMDKHGLKPQYTNNEDTCVYYQSGTFFHGLC